MVVSWEKTWERATLFWWQLLRCDDKDECAYNSEKNTGLCLPTPNPPFHTCSAVMEPFSKHCCFTVSMIFSFLRGHGQRKGLLSRDRWQAEDICQSPAPVTRITLSDLAGLVWRSLFCGPRNTDTTYRALAPPATCAQPSVPAKQTGSGQAKPANYSVIQ